jgi:peptidoglycan/LPS O-acetylase OafA/YrhL|tara:strand:- start:545 stop:1750 length:1206 start_codon:yes stop_codon:yes gene_type:complete
VDKKRYHDLDALRSCAMLLGIVIHGLLSFLPIPLPGAPQDINQNPEVFGYVFNYIHGFRMQLFFLISGFFTAMLWRKQGLRNLLKHRAKRILVPLIIATPITWILVIAIVGMYGDFPFAQAEAKFKESMNNPLALLAMGMWAPITGHLWFLYYLLWLILGFAVVIKLIERFRIKSISSRMIRSPWLWLIPLTLLPQLFNGLIGLIMGITFIGPDTFGGVIPWPPQLLYYAVFFAFGAICYGREEFDQAIGRRWQACFILSIPVLLLGIHWIELRNAAFKAGWDGNQSEIIWNHFLTNLCQLVFVWLMISGFIGFFRRFFSKENKRVRYISDASYWIYIAHMPPIMALQFWVSGWPYSSFLKFLFICTVTVGILLLIYEYAIRYTWVGTMLNGKRTRAPVDA